MLARMTLARIAALALLICATLSPVPATAQDIEAVTIVIDSLTTLPIGTGLVADSSADHFIVIARGARQLYPDLPMYDFGFDPSGLIRLQRLGQIMTDKPYGSLLGMFNPSTSFFFYLGDGGAIIAQPDDEGWELQLQVNMSAADHAASGGLYAVTVIRVPAGFPSTSASFAITSASTFPIDTDITANSGDRFVVRARGAISGPSIGLDEGWIDPSGMARLRRLGQPLMDSPYGSVLGSFSPSDVFNVGDGGAWTAQPVDYGSTFKLDLNMSALDQSSFQGRFIVTVDRFPAPATGVPSGDAAVGKGMLEVGGGTPNPMVSATTIAYRTGAAGRVRARIYDETGRWVRTVVDQQVPAGEHAIAWDGKDDSGGAVAPGVYFYQVSLEDRSSTGKLIVVR